MKTRALLLWLRLHESYWFYPALLLALGAAAAFGLTALDKELDGAGASGPLASIYSGGADGARAMLGAIATSVLAVAGTTFSITVAILSLTTSQFGPRLLRNFLRDTPNQLVLGTFIATFLYCLLVMRTVRSIDETSFVPHVSVSVGVGLAVACAAMLVYFIHHIVKMIQAAHFIAHAGRELCATIERLYPEEVGAGPAAQPGQAPALASPATPLRAVRSGYVQGFEESRLVALARETGGVVALRRSPGEFVVAGTVLAQLHGAADAGEAARKLDAATTFGPQSTETQDVFTPVDQLAEIATRALSTGINDPNTAIMCVDQLAAGFCTLAARRFPSPHRADGDGALRVIVQAPGFDDVLHRGFDPIRRHGRSEVRVLVRMLDACGTIAEFSGDRGRLGVLRDLADLALEAGNDALPSVEERTLLARHHARARTAIGRARG